MGFLRALSAGVSGLKGHQTMMDVIGNNISNINTIGFKSGRVTFSEAFAQTMRNANPPQSLSGGTNPQQVGLGMSVNSIDTQYAQGNIESTSNVTDLALQGTGFFIVKQNGRQLYTRAGAFSFDASGKMVNGGTGAIVQGRLATNGVLQSGNDIKDIVISPERKSAASATTAIQFAGNLNSAASVNTTPPNASTSTLAVPSDSATTGSAVVYDSLGNKLTVNIDYYKTAESPQTWAWTASYTDPTTGTVATPTNGSGVITFDTNGNLAGPARLATTMGITLANGADPLSFTVDFGTVGELDGLTSSKGTTSVAATPFGETKDGYGLGSLSNISIESDGTIRGIFTNGQLETLGQVMIADFTNPGGLNRIAGTMTEFSGNSGTANIGAAGTVNSSEILSSSLEQSNVDLAEEFTKMIIAQRGFQANAKVITSSDEFLQEIVGLKR